MTRHSSTFIEHRRALDCLDDNESYRTHNHYEEIDDCGHRVSTEADVLQMVHALLVHKDQEREDKEAKARVVEKGLHEHWDDDYKDNALQD